MKIKRNALCPCGSMNKFKRCCGSAAIINQKRHEEHEAFITKLKERNEKQEEELKQRRTGMRMRQRNTVLSTVLLAGAIMGMQSYGRDR